MVKGTSLTPQTNEQALLDGADRIISKSESTTINANEISNFEQLNFDNQPLKKIALHRTDADSRACSAPSGRSKRTFDERDSKSHFTPLWERSQNKDLIDF